MVEEVQESQENVEEFTAPTSEDMADVALNTLSKLTLRDLIDGTIQVLVELYTQRPNSYIYDASNYAEPVEISPFVDAVKCMRGDEEDADSDIRD